MELHRSVNNKMIAGICGGIAETLNIYPLIVRLIFLISILLGLSGLFVYIILWIILPVRNYNISFKSNFYRPLNDRLLGGVCMAIARSIKIDVSIIRILFIVTSLFFGSGFLIYLILWIAVPSESKIND